MRTKVEASPKRLPRTFQALHEIRPLMPIQDGVDLDNAQEIVDRLAILDRRTRGQDAYLETLTLLVESYEEVQHGIDTAECDPIESLRFLMKQHGMTSSQLGELLGQRQLGSKVLNGKRQLSKTHIQALCRHFKVSPALFLPVDTLD